MSIHYVGFVILGIICTFFLSKLLRKTIKVSILAASELRLKKSSFSEMDTNIIWIKFRRNLKQAFFYFSGSKML